MSLLILLLLLAAVCYYNSFLVTFLNHYLPNTVQYVLCFHRIPCVDTTKPWTNKEVYVCVCLFKPKTHCTIFTKDWHCETIVAMMPVFVWDSQKSCSVSLAFGTDQQISIFFSSDPCISPEQLNMQTNAILNSQRTVCVCVCVCVLAKGQFLQKDLSSSQHIL